ncbi:uncharacterized protein LOC110448251 [Mizuhopecten yessoensis]|uniref:Chitin-binding type-4 domain-containing protein n=1 Tax=Mizuhopecten yessoensis TaxID=6573 RepID=A0A210QTM2_MIZYE|nr:uncharacterized protein LOC110448251 [Mizuhopecten yessoensis]OWF52062.1 hypothetical protein KP79_PYT21252 [Mizuhopecten yessoensis]
MERSVLGTLFYILSCFCVTIYGHARLWEPPGRSSMWKRGFPTPVNTNDNELNCGGYQNLWIKYNGMCGICGDPYQQHPRENEAGGKYATGLVSRHYKTGDIATFAVDVTANHEGYFEFRLCPADGAVTQKCLDSYPVPVIGHPYGRYHLKTHENGIIEMQVKLPTGLACDKCVLQWRYRTGNRWNCDRESGKCGKGFGPQEEFYGCADISILDFHLSMKPPVSKPVTTVRRKSGRIRKPGVTEVKTPTKAVQVRNNILHRTFQPEKKAFSPIRRKSSRIRPSDVREIINPRKTVQVRNNILHRPLKPVKRAKIHKKPTSKTVRKGEQLNDLGGVLWKLLKSLTNRDSNGRNIALVEWDPVSHSYQSDIVYVRPREAHTGQTDRLSVNNVRSNWPPVRPMIVEASLDKPQTGPVILSESPFDQVIKKNILPTAFGNLKNISTCQGVNNFAKVSGIAKWCTVNCKAGNCPPVMCTCSRHINSVPIAIRPDTSIIRPVRPLLQSRVQTNRISHKTQPSTTSGVLRCKGSGHFARDRKILAWCNSNCNKGFCPKHMCVCI